MKKEVGEDAQQSMKLKLNRAEDSFPSIQNLEENEVQQQHTALSFCSSFGIAQVILIYIQTRDIMDGEIIFLMPCNKYCSFHPEDVSEHSQYTLAVCADDREVGYSG